MCGINGFNWKDQNTILKMNYVTKHRGPDDSGEYCDENVSLGSNRLAIIDLSSAGHQPMAYKRRNGSELKIVYNGEIYNFVEVKNELEQIGYSFNSNSDTEVILASYAQWGPSCVTKFIGMWAFAIYDIEAKIIFLSRDRFGIKPLYYWLDKENKFIFSSEIKGILAHQLHRRVNEEILFDFLFYGLLDHKQDTFFANVHRLMPGFNAVFHLDSKKLEIERYYDINTNIASSGKSPALFYELLSSSVRRHLVSDVPVGSCLSGGLDSSSIVCLMRMNDPQALIKTFSLVFPNLAIDETRYQEAVAKKIQAERFSVTFSPEELLDDLEELIETQEEPFGGISIYGQYRVMKLAHTNQMKVLLDGQGSDEILAGYDYLAAFYFYELSRRLKLLTLF